MFNIIIFIIINIINNFFFKKYYYYWKKTIDLIWRVKLKIIIIIINKIEKNIITIKEKP
jgi:hypothetical protein